VYTSLKTTLLHLSRGWGYPRADQTTGAATAERLRTCTEVAFVWLAKEGRDLNHGLRCIQQEDCQGEGTTSSEFQIGEIQ
jgi:hypothetical protein